MNRIAVLLILGIGLSYADALPSSGSVEQRAADRNQQAIVTNSQVEEWLRVWQNRLNLDRWKVDIRIVRASELNPDTLGHLKWNAADHTATIKVLNPVDYDLPASQIPQDIERTVVHELVHLQLSNLPRNGSKIVEEQVVVDITEALLQLERGGNYAAQNLGGMPAPRVRNGSSQNQASRSK